MATQETARTRRELVREAGHPAVSFVSVLAGTLVAFGALALLAAAAGAVGSQLGLSTDGVSSDEWRNAGIAGAAAGAVALFVSFFFGGYTAGRMGRRAGALHGTLVFALGLLIVGVITLLAALWGDADSVRQNLQAEGVPTDSATWSDIGLGAAIAGVLASLLGAVLGGMQGDRWHGRLLTAVTESRRERVRHEEEVRTRRLGQDPTTIDLREDDDVDHVDDEHVDDEHVYDTRAEGPRTADAPVRDHRDRDDDDEHVYDTRSRDGDSTQLSLEEERERERQKG
jgi:hypothetical protein